MVLAIVLSSAYGIYKRPDVTVPEGGEKLDESLSTAVFEQYVVDQAVSYTHLLHLLLVEGHFNRAQHFWLRSDTPSGRRAGRSHSEDAGRA